MYKRLSFKEIRLKQETLFHDALFCTFSKSLDLISERFDDLSAVEFWEEAKDVYSSLFSSSRPELLVYGINSELISRYLVFIDADGNTCKRTRDMARQSAMIVLTCVAYMLSTPNIVEGRLKDCLYAILELVSDNALFEKLYFNQRIAEQKEEDSGNPIPQILSDNTSTVYGRDALKCIPEDLRSCISNEEIFPEFIYSIRNGILQFINSKEGTAQMWKVVLDIAIERGYIARNCKVNRFAELLAAICPEAGDAKQIAQNAYHYYEKGRNYDNDRSCLIKFFPDELSH